MSRVLQEVRFVRCGQYFINLSQVTCIEERDKCLWLWFVAGAQNAENPLVLNPDDSRVVRAWLTTTAFTLS